MRFMKLCDSIIKEADDQDIEDTAVELDDNEMGTEEQTDNEEQFISGGKADGLTVDDIAKKLGVDVKEVEKALKQGAKVEAEHTDSKDIAESIAADHIYESGLLYYDALKKMEYELKNNISFEEEPEETEEKE